MGTSHSELLLGLVLDDDLLKVLFVGGVLPAKKWVLVLQLVDARIGSSGPFPVATLSRNHGVLNVFWTRSTKGASDALVETLSSEPGQIRWPGLDLHEVALVEELDDVVLHSLAHSSGVDSCHSCTK